jgi:hypothetical protein
MISFTRKLKNLVGSDRTITSNPELGVFETVLTPLIDRPDPLSKSAIKTSNKHSICLICLETCSEQRPMVSLLPLCPHEMCKNCFVRMIKYQGIDTGRGEPWANCPLCREPMDERLRWSVLPTSRFTCSYNFFTDFYSDAPSSNEQRVLVGLDSNGNGVLLENKVKIEIRQDGECTETVWVRELYLSQTSCPACIKRYSKSINCKPEEATRQAKKFRDFFDGLATVHPRDSKRCTIRGLDVISFWTPADSQTEDGEPIFADTWQQRLFTRRTENAQDPEAHQCTSHSGDSYYEGIKFNFKIRERYHRASFVPLRFPLEQRVAEDGPDEKSIFKAFVEIQKVIALSCPKVQQSSELAAFLESQGLRMSNTRLALNPQELFTAPTANGEGGYPVHRWVRRQPGITEGIMTAVTQFLGRRRIQTYGTDLFFGFDTQDYPSEAISRHISPWYTQLEEIHRANFS